MNPLLPQTPFIIGHTPDGQPVWLDPADYQPTPDQQQARAQSRQRGVLEGKARDLACQVLANREQWLQSRLIAVAPVEVGGALKDFMQGAAASTAWKASNKNWLEARLQVVMEWLRASGIHCMEPPYDGTTHRVFLKRGPDVLSEWRWKPVSLDNEVKGPAPTTCTPKG